MKILYGVFAAIVAMSSSSMSATVTDASGKVFVSRGEGFVLAVVGDQVEAGDKVFVGENSFAVVSYEECAVSISKPAVVTVAKKPVCDAVGAVAISPTADYADPATESADDYAIPVPLILLGTAAAVGTVAIVAGVLDDNESSVSAP